MKKGFEIGECYFCGQGNVYIRKAEDNGTWFVQCEECDTEWQDPEAFVNHQKPSMNKLGRSIAVQSDEVVSHAWRPFILNTFDLEET
jgi:hypothetical protein